MSRAIGFDAGTGALVIVGRGVYPAKTLTASVCPDGATIQIRSLAQCSEFEQTWSAVTDLDGNGFADLPTTLAYLQGEFAKFSPVGETFGIPVVAGADLLQGQPVAVSRASGQLLPARADTYTLAFVAGLASAVTAQGFVNQPAHGAVTLPDWSGLTGSAALSVGQIYFVGPTGGLTASPSLDTTCVARVGLATAPQTLVVEPSTPILL